MKTEKKSKKKGKKKILILLILLAVSFFSYTLYQRMVYHDVAIIGWGCIALFGAIMLLGLLFKDQLQGEDITDMYYETEEKK
jgi:hypothetical protein